MKRIIGLGVGVMWILAACGNETKKTGDVATCTDQDLAAGCQAGVCRLSAPLGTLGPNASVTLTRSATPSELAGDALGASVCTIALPAGKEDAVALTLSITMDADVSSDAALFEHVTTGEPDALVVASRPEGARVVSGLLRHSGTFGVTRRPGAWGIDAIAGIDVGATADAASLLRNLSSRPIRAAFFDGTRLYVGSGNRLLIWNSFPSSPITPPDVVLGQPNLDAFAKGTSSATWQGAITGIWSDGTKLVASEGNRVLIWNAIPTFSGAPADLVLGQPDFGTDAANTGGVSAQSMNEPMAVESDGTRLIVADMRNNRLLTWNAFPTSIDEPATGVIGQVDFTSTAANAGATPIYQTYGAVLDASGAFVTGMYFGGLFRIESLGVNPAPAFNVFALTQPKVRQDSNYLTAGLARIGSGLAVRDEWGNRVDVFRSVPASTRAIDFVLGQPDVARAVWHPTSASSFAAETWAPSLSGRGDRLLVPDGKRLLVFDKPSFNFAPATSVIGQAGFSTSESNLDYRSLSKRALGRPADVAVAAGKVAIADRGNNRVLIFDEADIASPSPVARTVLGQPDGTSFLPRAEATGMSGPSGVALDGTHLVVADTENHRVLIWNAIPSSDGQAADLVLGQADFTAHAPNHGRGDGNQDGFSDADADGFFQPTGVATDGTHLLVSDRVNHRVLVWKTWPTKNGQAADAVIGQATFTEVRPNHGTGAFVPTPNGLNLPTGIALVGGSLYVADTENNRIVRWDDPFGTPVPAAFGGQPDGATITNPNIAPPDDYAAGSPRAQPTSAASVLRPRGIAVTSDKIFVSEVASNRVHVLGADMTHLGVLGQPTSTDAGANTNGLSPRSMTLPFGVAASGTFLYVCDSGNNRVLRFDVNALTGAPATDVIGQASMFTGGFDQGGAASAGAVAHARGLALSRGELFVADTDNNRVLVFDSPPSPGAKPKRVIGQADANTILPNGGGMPGAGTLFNPRGVHAGDRFIAVADTKNHRVLLFDRTSSSGSAKFVLGQPDFHANAAGAASAATLKAPEGVFVAGDRVLVADTGNHRVLVWNQVTASGQPADIVLGQASMNDALPNRGGAPTAGSLLLPSSVVFAKGAIFVADTGNNRILRWSAPASGAPADAVLGQTDFTARSAAVVGTDLQHLASPIALATDDAYLYALDRDIGRVVGFTLVAPSGSAAVESFGALGGLSLESGGGLAVERTPLFTSRLVVSDTQASHLVVVGGASRLR